MDAGGGICHLVPYRKRRTPVSYTHLDVYKRQIWSRQLRVAAYCRVSTPYEEQQKSLEKQIEYFTQYIKRNPFWRFVAVYADNASGLHAKNRPGYQKMLKDCRKGKIDLILVKSLSRFGRDAKETMTTIRRLKQMGIGVYIELGGINTLTSPDSVVDLYAAFDQAESQNKSDNIKFGLRRRMKSGKAMLNHSQFLGYTKAVSYTHLSLSTSFGASFSFSSRISALPLSGWQCFGP